MQPSAVTLSAATGTSPAPVLSSADLYCLHIQDRISKRSTNEILAISYKDVAAPTLDPKKELRIALERLVDKGTIASFNIAVNESFLVCVTPQDFCSTHPDLQAISPNWIGKQAPKTPVTPIAPPSLQFTSTQRSCLGQIIEVVSQAKQVVKLTPKDFESVLKGSPAPAADLLKAIRQLVYREREICTFAIGQDGQSFFVQKAQDHNIAQQLLTELGQAAWYSAEHPEPNLAPEEAPIQVALQRPMAPDTPARPLSSQTLFKVLNAGEYNQNAGYLSLKQLESLVPLFRQYAENRSLQATLSDRPLPYRTLVDVKSFGANHHLDAYDLYTFMRYLVLTDRIASISYPTFFFGTSSPITAYGAEYSHPDGVLTKELMLQMYAKRKELSLTLQIDPDFSPQQKGDLLALMKSINDAEVQRLASRNKQILEYGYNPDWTPALDFLVRENKIFKWATDQTSVFIQITPQDTISLAYRTLPDDLVWKDKNTCVQEEAFRKAHRIDISPLDLSQCDDVDALQDFVRFLNQRVGPGSVTTSTTIKSTCQFLLNHGLIHGFEDGKNNRIIVYVKAEDRPQTTTQAP